MQFVLKIANRARENGEPTVHLEVVVAGVLEPCLYELLQGGGVIQSSDTGRFTVREPGSYSVILRDAMGKCSTSNQVDLTEGWFA